MGIKLNSIFNTININFVEEDRKPSLPSSPFLSIKDNISFIPDGEFSREKEEIFERQIKRLITPLRFNSNIYGKTLLEKKIFEKRYF